MNTDNTAASAAPDTAAPAATIDTASAAPPKSKRKRGPLAPKPTAKPAPKPAALVAPVNVEPAHKGPAWFTPANKVADFGSKAEARRAEYALRATSPEAASATDDPASNVRARDNALYAVDAHAVAAALVRLATIDPAAWLGRATDAGDKARRKLNAATAGVDYHARRLGASAGKAGAPEAARNLLRRGSAVAALTSGLAAGDAVDGATLRAALTARTASRKGDTAGKAGKVAAK